VPNLTTTDTSVNFNRLDWFATFMAYLEFRVLAVSADPTLLDHVLRTATKVTTAQLLKSNPINPN
jgi:hypothetical protein